MYDVTKGPKRAAHDRARLLGSCLLAWCAALAPQFAHAQQRSPFRLERFEEDWTEAHADDTFGAEWKNLPISDDITVSIGADARWRIVSLDAPRLGLGGADADSWRLQRLLAHADVHVAGRGRLFVQLGSHDGFDREIPSPNDNNGADLQQAFIDARSEIFGGEAMVRLGRQELVLGPRYVTARDSANVRQRHELARLSYTHGEWRADLFAGRPVAIDPGAWDDRADPSQAFYGARLARRSGAETLEIYAYALDRDAAPLAGSVSSDERVSLGLRLADRRGALDFDGEFTLQRGRFGAQDIRAFGGAFDLGYTWSDAAWAPRLGVRLTYGSGDDDRSDSVQGTFAPPFPNSNWFGPNGLGSFSNTIETAATLKLDPTPDVLVNLKLGALSRAETEDFAYSGSTYLLGTDGGGDATVGVAANVLALWFVTDNLVIAPNLSFLRVSEEMTRRGADDVAFAQLVVSLQF